MKGGEICLRGLREHNLRDLNLDLPRGSWITITGVSGSGKSSLAFDTLFAEGQRRYLESLAVHGHLLPRPNFDLIEGLPPTLAIGQGIAQLSIRQTVGTVTEIHDLLAVLYARIGIQHSPATGERLWRHTPQQVVAHILESRPEGSRVQIYAPLALLAQFAFLAERLERMGYTRLRVDGKPVVIEEGVPTPTKSADVVVDRLAIKPGIRERLTESVILAMNLGQGRVVIDQEAFADHYICPQTQEHYLPLRPLDFHRQGLEASRQAQAVLIEGHTLPQLLAMEVPELDRTLREWTLEGNAQAIAAEILPRIHRRLELMTELGLGYLNLDRIGNTLSVGETQRVQLTAQIGARLAGIAYIMDEPSRGLHPVDVATLSTLLRRLQSQGNTLLVVEHDAGLIQAADQVIELGPGAGRNGGRLLYQGSAIANADTPTGRWLSGIDHLEPHTPRKPTGHFELSGITLHNLRDVSVRIPLGVLVGICGVSGSGKSSLVIDAIAPKLKQVSLIDQKAAGFSTRSIPATYVGIMTPLRKLLSDTPLARARGYTPAQFSLNRKGGRCEACEGRGQMRIKLTPLPDIWTPCEVCRGTRYNFETVQVAWNGQSIGDILEMTVSEAIEVFEPVPQICSRLTLMVELGLDYLQLGQPFPNLSGGEAQRLKLVAELARPAHEPITYILDEPSSGLHAADIAKLVTLLHRLVEQGHSVWVIEHKLEILQQADWLIELGPGAGPQGGQIVFAGTPTQLRAASTATAQFCR